MAGALDGMTVLDLSILVRMWPIALTLAFGRILFTFLGCRLGHRLAKDPDEVRKYAFTSFISQAGVTIGLAQLSQLRFVQKATAF